MEYNEKIDYKTVKFISFDPITKEIKSIFDVAGEVVSFHHRFLFTEIFNLDFKEMAIMLDLDWCFRILQYTRSNKNVFWSMVWKCRSRPIV